MIRVATLPDRDYNSTYLLETNDRKNFDGEKLQTLSQVQLNHTLINEIQNG